MLILLLEVPDQFSVVDTLQLYNQLQKSNRNCFWKTDMCNQSWCGIKQL